jgi:hypothetical protein
VGSGIELARLPITVSTWRAWRAAHPQTTVVGLETGYDRDYSPGAAYGKYFASPDTMFPVWKRDAALPPKEWIYGLRDGAAARAFRVETLWDERVVNDRVGGLPVVLVADPESRSIRAYGRGVRMFAEGPSPSEVVEPATGEVFRVEEEALYPAVAAGGESLPRVPGHLAYWFGWYAQYPETSRYESCLIAPSGGR